MGIVMYDNEFEQRKIEFEPRIKLNHNILERGIKAQFKRRTSQDTNQNGRIKSMLSVTIEAVELSQILIKRTKMDCGISFDLFTNRT